MQRDFSLVLPCGLVCLTGLWLYAPESLSLTQNELILLTRAQELIGGHALDLYNPLYLLLLGYWQQLASHPLLLRLPGLICGLLAVVLSTRVLRMLIGAHAVPSALLLLAGAPFFVAQIRALTPAPLALVATLLCSWVFLEYLRAGQRTWLGAWLITSILSWGIQTGLIFLILVQGATMLLYRRRYSGYKERRWWLAQIPVVAIFLLAFWQPFSHFLSVRLPAFSFEQATGTIDLCARLSTNLSLPQALPGMLVIILVALPGLRAADWRKDPRHGFLALSLLTPCLFYLCTSQSEALLLCALPALSGLAALGLRLYPRWARQGLWSAVSLSYIWSYWHLY